MIQRKKINIAVHKPTGAEIPIEVISKDENNVITKYREWCRDRKYFTIAMLEKRWSKSKEEVTEILKRFEVPGHLNKPNMMSGKLPMDDAIFFEEYIYGIEKKENMKHSKLKSRLLK